MRLSERVKDKLCDVAGGAGFIALTGVTDPITATGAAQALTAAAKIAVSGKEDSNIKRDWLDARKRILPRIEESWEAYLRQAREGPDWIGEADLGATINAIEQAFDEWLPGEQELVDAGLDPERIAARITDRAAQNEAYAPLFGRLDDGSPRNKHATDILTALSISAFEAIRHEEAIMRRLRPLVDHLLIKLAQETKDNTSIIISKLGNSIELQSSIFTSISNNGNVIATIESSSKTIEAQNALILRGRHYKICSEMIYHYFVRNDVGEEEADRITEIILEGNVR